MGRRHEEACRHLDAAEVTKLSFADGQFRPRQIVMIRFSAHFFEYLGGQCRPTGYENGNPLPSAR